jgi:hypothetical protein
MMPHQAASLRLEQRPPRAHVPYELRPWHYRDHSKQFCSEVRSGRRTNNAGVKLWMGLSHRFLGACVSLMADRVRRGNISRAQEPSDLEYDPQDFAWLRKMGALPPRCCRIHADNRADRCKAGHTRIAARLTLDYTPAGPMTLPLRESPRRIAPC